MYYYAEKIPELNALWPFLNTSSIIFLFDSFELLA